MDESRSLRYAGCLLGQCVGDAVGFPVEGEAPDICRSYLDLLDLGNKTEELGRGGYVFGQYTDDSQLARELMQSVVDRGRFDPADYAQRIAAIFDEFRIVGRGIATHEAAMRLIDGTPWDEAGTPPPSAGNGTAMRAAPVGLLHPDNPEHLIADAHDQSRITHTDPRCSAGAVAVAGATAIVLRDDLLDPQAFCDELSGWVQPFDDILAGALRELPRWIQQRAGEAVAEIGRVGVLPPFEAGWHGISPFVTTSVLWSLYAFLRNRDDYWAAIRDAIVCGGDVDTTAAMTGAIAGARLGVAAVPETYLRLINDNGGWGRDALTDLATRFLAVACG